MKPEREVDQGALLDVHTANIDFENKYQPIEPELIDFLKAIVHWLFTMHLSI